MSTLRITFKGLLWGNTVENVVHFNNRDAITTLTAAADDVDTNWLANIRRFQHTQFQWTNIEVRDVTSAGPPAPFNKPINEFGLGAGAGSNDNPILAYCLKLSTAVAGRHGRGRVFIAAVPQAGTNIGLFAAVHVASLATYITNIKNRYVGTGTSNLQLVVCPRAAPGDIIPVTDIAIRTVVSVQRRRNYGVGI